MWWTDMPAPSATHTHNHTGRFSLVQICSHDKYEFERIFYVFFGSFSPARNRFGLKTTQRWREAIRKHSLHINACWIIELCIHRIYFMPSILCAIYFIRPNNSAAEKREKYLRNNWTSRKCLGIKLSEVTADAVYRWLVCSTILSPSSAARSVSFGARFYCSINVWQRLSVSAHASNKRAEWTKCYFDCDFQLMWDARNRIENHLLSRTDRMNL